MRDACICATRAFTRVEELEKLGYRNVTTSEGGFHGWVGASQPVIHLSDGPSTSTWKPPGLEYPRPYCCGVTS